VPVDRRTSCSPRTVRRPWSRRSRSPPLLGSRGVAGRTRYLGFGDAYHGDTWRALGRCRRFDHVFDPLRFPVAAPPSFSDPRCIEKACALLREHAHVARWCGARWCRRGRHAACCGRGFAPLAPLPRGRAADLRRVATASAAPVAVRLEPCALRPDLIARQGSPALPAMSATGPRAGASTRRSSARPVGAHLLPRHSFGGTALAAAVRAPPPPALRRVGRARERARARRRAGQGPRRARAPCAACASAPAG